MKVGYSNIKIGILMLTSLTVPSSSKTMSRHRTMALVMAAMRVEQAGQFEN